MDAEDNYQDETNYWFYKYTTISENYKNNSQSESYEILNSGLGSLNSNNFSNYI